MDLEWGGAKDVRSFLFEPAIAAQIAAQWERSWREAQPH
jgi:hypothetical protein